MDGNTSTPNNSKRSIIILLIVLFLLLVFLYHGIYKYYFQFNRRDVQDYINEECAKLPAEKRLAAYKLINDGVRSILKDRYQTKQVLTKARENGTPREMELVHASVMENISRGYLKF